MRRSVAPSQSLYQQKKTKLDDDVMTFRSISGEVNSATFYSIVYGKPTKKKHKTWEGDGFIVVTDSSVKLLDSDGKEIGNVFRRQLGKISIEEGSSFCVGSKLIEVVDAIKELPIVGRLTQSTSDCQSNRNFQSKAVRNGFRPVMRISDESKENKVPSLGNVVVMPRPSAMHIFRHNNDCASICDVVLDPVLSDRLRPHQIEGVVFLYECVLGLRSHGGTGAILADAMGLGKSVQTISLIWTLLNQQPYGSGPLLTHCLIVCPCSLVLNWQREFAKWLGDSRLRPYCVSGDTRLEQYLQRPINPVLILSYETLLRNIDALRHMQFGLLVCDEAHRLKNAGIRTAQAIDSLDISRRVLLTGTPLQNDMDELFALAECSNPGVFHRDRDRFRREFSDPLTGATQPNASSQALECGRDAQQRLQRFTQSFMLRRTETVSGKYLPPKNELIVFCRPTERQLQLYRLFLECRTLQRQIDSCPSDRAVETLSALVLLRKLCNMPSLFVDTINKNDDSSDDLLSELRTTCGGHMPEDDNSGKLEVTVRMLRALTPGDKLVIVSHFTAMLDVLSNVIVESLGFVVHRIDGNTPAAVRMRTVNTFNEPSTVAQPEVLLLSCRAGGEGLNLTGACQIILYDFDWNPAADAQALARVWRDGQRRPVTVYRLVTAATLDECLLQRQAVKQQLSATVVDLTTANDKEHRTFSRQELRDLFSLHDECLDEWGCWTHRLLDCPCQNDEVPKQRILPATVASPIFQVGKHIQLGLQLAKTNSAPVGIDRLSSWDHLVGANRITQCITDSLLLAAVDLVTCVFKRTTTDLETE